MRVHFHLPLAQGSWFYVCNNGTLGRCARNNDTFGVSRISFELGVFVCNFQPSIPLPLRTPCALLPRPRPQPRLPQRLVPRAAEYAAVHGAMTEHPVPVAGDAVPWRLSGPGWHSAPEAEGGTQASCVRCEGKKRKKRGKTVPLIVRSSRAAPASFTRAPCTFVPLSFRILP